MTVLERKARFISAILTDVNEKRFVETERFYRILKKRNTSQPEPCIYTVEELRASINQQVTDYEAGIVELIPHEQIKRKIAR
jgi:hypothetical protein